MVSFLGGIQDMLKANCTNTLSFTEHRNSEETHTRDLTTTFFPFPLLLHSSPLTIRIPNLI